MLSDGRGLPDGQSTVRLRDCPALMRGESSIDRVVAVVFLLDGAEERPATVTQVGRVQAVRPVIAALLTVLH